MARLAENGNWDEDFKTDENGKRAGSQNTNFPKREKAQYVKWDKSGDYKVRLIGPHVKCRKHFKPYKATVQDDEKNIDPAWLAGFFPQQRYAINVIDRTDGQLKILEKPWEVFKHFANYKSIFGKDPSSVKDGPDFMIKVVIPKNSDGSPNPFKTEYTVTHLKDTPLTKEEIEMLKTRKETLGASLWPLKEIYRSTTAEKMKEMWDALPDDKKIPPKKVEKPVVDEKVSSPAPVASTPTPPVEVPPVEVKKPAPVEEKMVNAPADKDDLFATEAVTESAGDVDSAELF